MNQETSNIELADTNRSGFQGAAFTVRADFTYYLRYRLFLDPLIYRGSHCNPATGEQIEVAQMQASGLKSAQDLSCCTYQVQPVPDIEGSF